MPATDPMTEGRDCFLRMVESLDASKFTPLKSEADLPSKILAHSTDWDLRVFRAKLGPNSQAAGVVRRSVHVAGTGTWDLLRHEYRVGSLEITVTENPFFMFIVVRRKLGSDPLQDAETLAPDLLSVPGPIRFQAVDDPARRLFSSAQDRRINRLDEWSDRVDGVFFPDAIAFLCFKARLDGDLRVQPFDRWFDDDFRGRHRK